MSEQFIPFADAIGAVDRLIAAAEAGDVVTIMRADEPIAVIVGVDEFDRLTAAVEMLAH